MAKYEEKPTAPPSGVLTQLFAVVQEDVLPHAPPVRMPPMRIVRQLLAVRTSVEFPWMLASNTYGARSV